jgi:hypothetical protein
MKKLVAREWGQDGYVNALILRDRRQEREVRIEVAESRPWRPAIRVSETVVKRKRGE